MGKLLLAVLILYILWNMFGGALRTNVLGGRFGTGIGPGPPVTDGYTQSVNSLEDRTRKGVGR